MNTVDTSRWADPRLNTESTANAAPSTAAEECTLESKKYIKDHSVPACASRSVEHSVGSDEADRRYRYSCCDCG